MTDSVKRPEAAIGARLSVMMFLEFFVWGGWYVTLGTYMGANNFGPIANGWAYSLCPIAAVISPFFTGMVADRFFATERVLGVLQLLAGAALLAVPFAAKSGGTAFMACLLIHTLCFMPTLSLTNSLALSHMTNAEKQFPMVRVFGTIGWIVAGFIVSKVLNGDKTAVPFMVAGAAAVLLGLFSFTLPHTPAPSAGQKATLRDIAGLDSIVLLKKPSFALFVAGSFLICIPLAFYYQLANRFVEGSGIANPAFKMTFGQMSEIFFMVVMPFCFARLGVKWMLLVGMAAWVLRYGLFAGAATTGIMPLIIGGIVLHGVCYDFFFVTGQIYVDNVASTKIRGQAQGFLVLVTQGVGMFIGAQVAANLVAHYTVAERVNWTMVWGIPCIAAAVIMLVFAATFKAGNEQKPAEELAA